MRRVVLFTTLFIYGFGRTGLDRQGIERAVEEDNSGAKGGVRYIRPWAEV